MLDSYGHPTEALVGIYGIRAKALCWSDGVGKGDSVEVESDWGDAVADGMCPSDHPWLGFEGNQSQVKCQIKRFEPL
jgi:hypothetical protein